MESAWKGLTLAFSNDTTNDGRRSEPACSPAGRVYENNRGNADEGQPNVSRARCCANSDGLCPMSNTETSLNPLRRMYNTLVERCFNSCVNSFRSKSLDKYETPCIGKQHKSQSSVLPDQTAHMPSLKTHPFCAAGRKLRREICQDDPKGRAEVC